MSTSYTLAAKHLFITCAPKQKKTPDTVRTWFNLQRRHQTCMHGPRPSERHQREDAALLMMMLALTLLAGTIAFVPHQQPGFSQRANVQMSSIIQTGKDRASGTRLGRNHQEVIRTATTAAMCLSLMLAPTSALAKGGHGGGHGGHGGHAGGHGHGGGHSSAHSSSSPRSSASSSSSSGGKASISRRVLRSSSPTTSTRSSPLQSPTTHQAPSPAACTAPCPRGTVAAGGCTARLHAAAEDDDDCRVCSAPACSSIR